MAARCAFQASTGLGSLRHAFGPRLVHTLAQRYATVAVLRPRVVVAGGGFAGLSTALRLSSLPWTRLTRPEITVVDKADRFCFLPMLYELALGQAESWEVAPSFDSLLRDTRIKFVQAEIENVDVVNGLVQGRTTGAKERNAVSLPFDRAVLAVGGQTAGVEKVPGAAEFACPFYRYEDALRVKSRLRELQADKGAASVINVVVVGGGFTGVEAASCVADYLSTSGSVLIVETGDRLLGRGTDFNRQAAEKMLRENGVVVEYRSIATEITKDSVTMSGSNRDAGESSQKKPFTAPADLVIWTAGAKPCSNLPAFDVPLDVNGRVITDSFLQVKGFEDRLYALGDSATVPSGGPYAGTAQVAVQQAEYAAWNTWASLTGRPKLEYRYAHLGEMMVLGSNAATVTASVGVEVDGKAAWAMRRAAYLARMPTDRHRARVAASWAANPLLRGVADVAAQSKKYKPREAGRA